MTKSSIAIWVACIAAFLALSVALAVTMSSRAITYLGLLTVIGSALVSMRAALDGIKAAQAVSHLQVADFTASEPPESHSFDSTYGLRGKKHDRVEELEDHVASLQNEVLRLRSDFRQRQRWTDARMEVFLGLFRHHKEVAVPTSIAESARTVVMSSFLTIAGSVLLADANAAHSALAHIGRGIAVASKAAMNTML